MAGFAPASYIAGPAIVTYDSQSYYTKGDITVRSLIETWEVQTSMWGKIDDRMKSRAYEIRFVPCGEVEAIAKYFPYAASSIGASIFPASDKALTIQTLAGQLYTFTRAAMTKMPGLRLGANETAFTEMAFTSLLQTSVEPTTEASFYSVAANAFSSTAFSETAITSPGYTASWAGQSAMESLDGFTVEINLRFKMDYVDRYGLVAMRLLSIEPTARFTPVGLTEAEYEAIVLGDGASAIRPGMSLGNAGSDLIISKAATYLKVTIPDAGVMSYGFAFGEAPRLGELVFMSKHGFTTGAASAIYTVEIQAA